MKAIIISAFLFVMALADHDHRDFSHGLGHTCSLADECDAGSPSRVTKCSSLDTCYDYEGYNPTGDRPKEVGDDTICGPGETCARGTGPEGPFHVCVLAMYCNMGSAAIYRAERTSTSAREKILTVPFTCPNIKRQHWQEAAAECNKLKPPATPPEEEDFLTSEEYLERIRMQEEQKRIIANTTLDHNGDPYLPYGYRGARFAGQDDYGDTYHVWENTVKNPLSYSILFMFLFCLICCIYSLCKGTIARRRRDGLAVDLYGLLAVALAKQHNKDPVKVQRERVETGYGVGRHPDNIQEWVSSMWYNMKKDPSTKLDREELKLVIDTTLLNSNMYQRYEEADVDDLMMHFSTYENGKVSQSEMYEFLRGMTRAKPPGENYLTFKGCQCACSCAGIADWFKNLCKRKTPAASSMPVETTEKKKKKKKKEEPAAQLVPQTTVVTLQSQPDANVSQNETSFNGLLGQGILNLMKKPKADGIEGLKGNSIISALQGVEFKLQSDEPKEATAGGPSQLAEDGWARWDQLDKAKQQNTKK